MTLSHVTLFVAAIAAGTAVSRVAHCEPRPVVCLAFTEATMPVDGTPTKVAICTDRKRPVVLTTYTIATVKDSEGKAVRAAVGYR